MAAASARAASALPGAPARAAGPEEGPGNRGGNAEGLFRRRPLDPPDTLEEAGLLHFQALRESVFTGLRIDFGEPDPNAPHGWALSELSWIAASGPERQKSVCLGLIYALLAHTWDRCQTPYWDYLGLLCGLDAHSVTVRALLAVARRYRALLPPSTRRFLVLLADMVEARWPQVEKVFLAVQREIRPGDGQPECLEGLAALLRMARSGGHLWSDESAVQCTFVWVLRWATAMAEPTWRSTIRAERNAELRGECIQLAAVLWARAPEILLQTGPAFWWALLPCREELALAELWRQAEEWEERLLAAVLPACCLSHHLSAEEEEQLGFLVAETAEHREAPLFRWFLCRHLSPPSSGAPVSDVHVADCVLWALAAAGGPGRPRPALWARFWALAGEHGRAAFAFAASRGGPDGQYALAAAEGLRGAGGDPAVTEALRLAAKRLPGAAAAAFLASLGG